MAPVANRAQLQAMTRSAKICGEFGSAGQKSALPKRMYLFAEPLGKPNETYGQLARTQELEFTTAIGGGAVHAVGNREPKKSLPRFARLTSRELHGPHNSFAFLHEDQLIGLDVFQSVHLTAGPADFQQIHFFRFSDSEVNPQVVL